MLSRMIIGVCAVALLVDTVSQAAVPASITVQGRVTDASNNPLPAGAKSFVFRIFNASVGGTEIWPGGAGEMQTITTSSDGLWIGLVGAISPLTDVVFTDTLRWLQITVTGTTLPRIRLVTGPFAYRVATVDGALGGTVTSEVSIGSNHTNTGTNAFVTGYQNTVSGEGSSITGGSYNNVSGASTIIGGGVANAASGGLTVIGGGRDNNASGNYATIGGGFNNKARGSFSTIAGGGGSVASDSNAASGDYSAIAGGTHNVASAEYSFIGGGSYNQSSGFLGSVAGGSGNRAVGVYAAVGGGSSNQAEGLSSCVPGGQGNLAQGQYSFAAGRFAFALHDGSFVWTDGQGGYSQSTAPNQFLIHAVGGVGIGTESPTQALHVAGDIRAGGSLPMGISTEVNEIINLDANFRLKANDDSRGGAFRIDTRTPDGNSHLFGWFSRAPGSPVDVSRMVLTEAGDLGIGVLNPTNPLEMASGARCTAVGTWTNASSRSYKTDIQALKTSEYSDILEKLNDVDVVRFRYKTDPARLHLGLIAEDVPDEMASDDRTGVPTADAIAFLMAALKAQQAKIESLEESLMELKGAK